MTAGPLVASAAFAVAVAYWPGFWYPGEASRWIALSLLIPPALALAPRPIRSRTWWLGAGFLAWTALSVLWSVSPATTVHTLWKVLLFGGAALVGSALTDRRMRTVLIAFAIGIAVNAGFAIVQAQGYSPVVQIGPPAGLFVNKNLLVQAGLLAFVAMIAWRVWWLVPSSAVAAFLPLSRGVVMAACLTAGLWLVRERRWRLALAAVVAAGAVVAFVVWLAPSTDHSASERWSLWRDTLAGLTFPGYGPGAFDSAYPAFVKRSVGYFFGMDILPGSPHNDALLLLSEWGAGAVFLFAMAGCALLRGHGPALYIVAAFVFAGLTDVPFQHPATGFVACLCLGHLLRRGADLRGDVFLRRDPL